MFLIGYNVLMKVRKGTANDLADMFIISCAAHQGHAKYLPKDRRDDLLELYKSSTTNQTAFKKRCAKIMQAGAVIFVAEQAKKVCGYAIVLKRTNEARYELKALFVHPEAQGKGIGTDILLAVIQYANGHDITGNVIRENERALAFYTRNGFKVRQQSTDKFMGADQLVISLS
jgi:ribosomal protein S18 acetylase RimI-like enzyme